MQVLIIIPIMLFAGCSTLRGPEAVDPAKVCSPGVVAAHQYDNTDSDNVSRKRGQVICAPMQ